MSIVSLVKVEETEASLEKAIHKALDLTQFDFSEAINNIAIKPNLCFYWDYSTGMTTDPRFISALIDVIRNKTSPSVKISIVESDASAMSCKYAFKMLGYEKMAREKSVKLVNLTKHKFVKTKVNVNGKSHEFLIPQTITKADLLINVPKLKCMPQIKISCTLKNIYGCNPYPKKFIYHKWLDEAIVGLYKIIKPNLCVLDGIFVKGTKTMKLGLVMASTDPVALDAAASRIAGINPKSIRHIVLASKEKIGSINFIPKGDDLAYFKNLFPRKDIKYEIRSFLLTFYNRFLHSAYLDLNNSLMT